MKFEPTVCSDCSYPPNFIVTAMPNKSNRQCFSVKCRDCGDSWEEMSWEELQDSDLDEFDSDDNE